MRICVVYNYVNIYIATYQESSIIRHIHRGLTATHCNTLQHTATQCNTLQHTATHCNSLQHTATHCNTLQRTATHCNSLQHTCHESSAKDTPIIAVPRREVLMKVNICLIPVYISIFVSNRCLAVCCGVLRCAAVCCSVLQRVAARCSVLQTRGVDERLPHPSTRKYTRQQQV